MCRQTNTSRALPVVLVFATLLFLVLGIGALGIIGDGDADRIYLAVVVVFAFGTIVARFRPQPMAVAGLFAFAAWLFARSGRQHPRHLGTQSP